MYRVGFIATVILGVSFCFTAMADDFVTKKSLQKSSDEGVFFSKTMPILESVTRNDRKTTLEQHVSAFRAGLSFDGAASVEDVRQDSIGTEDWNLTSYGDGDAVSYNNNNELLEAIYFAKSGDKCAMSSSQAVEVANAYIKNNLSKHFVVGKEESIEPFHLRYVKYQDSPEELISGYYVIYSRLYNKINIIGPGSKVRVHVGITGNLVGFRYDWPDVQYKTEVKTVTRDVFYQRLSMLCDNSHLNCENAKISRLECGLYDYGNLERYGGKSNLIQPACYVQIDELPGTKEFSGIIYFVPIAELDSIVPDANWKESLIIKNMAHLIPDDDGGIEDDKK